MEGVGSVPWNLTQGLPRNNFDGHTETSNIYEALITDLNKIAPNLTEKFKSSGGLDISIIDRFERNRKVDGPAMIAIIIIYCVLILIGTAGNLLVVVAVVRNPSMRTARNIFIINLAISDLVLCLVTAPLTLVEIITQYWPLGNTPFLCKLVGVLQATNIFVSTISITAIALDRHHVSSQIIFQVS